MSKLQAVVSELYQQAQSSLRARNFMYPVRNRTDTDIYKFLMGQFIYRFYRDVEVTFELIVRDKTIPLWQTINEDELRASLDYAMSLPMRRTDLVNLRGLDCYGKNLFDEEYLTYLSTSRLPQYSLTKVDGLSKLSFRGRWVDVSPWEITSMEIVSALYYRATLRNLSEYDFHGVYAVANARLQSNLIELEKNPLIQFSDFSSRRRDDFLWQEYVISECKRVLGDQFLGTSNVYLAARHDYLPKGTNAHETQMVMTAIAKSIDEMLYAQYRFYEQWREIHGPDLQIILPDTYGPPQFWANAPAWLADWKGQRQDSGDPIVEGERYITWLISKGKDPKTKMIIFSDGLDLATMKKIFAHFKGRIQISFGWGTRLGNDFAGSYPAFEHMRPFSMVCKVVEANGRPCVKLSADINKATGPKAEVARYLEIFGGEGRTARKVIV